MRWIPCSTQSPVRSPGARRSPSPASVLSRRRCVTRVGSATPQRVQRMKAKKKAVPLVQARCAAQGRRLRCQEAAQAHLRGGREGELRLRPSRPWKRTAAAAKKVTGGSHIAGVSKKATAKKAPAKKTAAKKTAATKTAAKKAPAKKAAAKKAPAKKAAAKKAPAKKPRQEGTGRRKHAAKKTAPAKKTAAKKTAPPPKKTAAKRRHPQRRHPSRSPEPPSRSGGDRRSPPLRTSQPDAVPDPSATLMWCGARHRARVRTVRSTSVSTSRRRRRDLCPHQAAAPDRSCRMAESGAEVRIEVHARCRLRGAWCRYRPHPPRTSAA